MAIDNPHLQNNYENLPAEPVGDPVPADISHVSTRTFGKILQNNNVITENIFTPLADNLNDIKTVKPKMLIVSDYIYNSERQGFIICWNKIADASGYIIKRKSIFDQKEKLFDVDNVTASKNTSKYINNLQSLLELNSSVKRNNTFCFVDNELISDRFYYYTVKAYQNIPVQNSKLIFSQRIIFDATTQYVRNTLNDDSLDSEFVRNPYDTISRILYNNEKYGWILSGLTRNIYVDNLPTIQRARTQEELRRQAAAESVDYKAISYVERKFSEVLSVDRFPIFYPEDINIILTNIEESLRLYGLSVTLEKIFTEVGITDTLTEKQTNDMTAYRRFLQCVKSSIDPNYSVCNVDILRNNLREIFLPNRGQQSSLSDNSIQQRSSFTSTVSDTEIDMFTVDGISKLLNVIDESYRRRNAI